MSHVLSRVLLRFRLALPENAPAKYTPLARQISVASSQSQQASRATSLDSAGGSASPYLSREDVVGGPPALNGPGLSGGTSRALSAITEASFLSVRGQVSDESDANGVNDDGTSGGMPAAAGGAESGGQNTAADESTYVSHF
jgi:hypothetical protein